MTSSRPSSGKVQLHGRECNFLRRMRRTTGGQRLGSLGAAHSLNAIGAASDDCQTVGAQPARAVRRRSPDGESPQQTPPSPAGTNNPSGRPDPLVQRGQIAEIGAVSRAMASSTEGVPSGDTNTAMSAAACPSAMARSSGQVARIADRAGRAGLIVRQTELLAPAARRVRTMKPDGGACCTTRPERRRWPAGCRPV